MRKGLLSCNMRKMNAVFPYRGPDDEGYFVDDKALIGFAHRRLSILDTSKAGAQPMKTDDGNLVIIHNGEVYNYLEIRKTLQHKGHMFVTETDTEVILAAYKEWGVACLNYFNGMWAFAIFDRMKNSVFIARDRLGIKPLYYYQDNLGVLYFASEVKAILAGTDEQPEFQPFLIDTYMSFGYIPGENTFFKGIKRLLPGHYLMVENNHLSINRYWNLDFQDSSDHGLAYYVEKGTSLLNNAIDLRLRSDVPLGIFLSGGLDSSAVVGLLSPRVTEPLKTFSVAYDFGKNYNETPHARIVAEKFNTDHHEFFVSQKQFKEFIPDFIKYMDEPVTEAAAISLFFISKLAKDHVTVVLSGEGSDEIFGGYDFYRYMGYLEKYRNLMGGKAVGKITKIAENMLPPGNKLRKYLCLANTALEHRYKGISTYEEHIKKALYRESFKKVVLSGQNSKVQQFQESLFHHTENCDPLSRMLYFDTKTWLVDDLLIKADRMSMAASLELRVPFLDYHLVEFAANLPSQYKIHKGNHKYLLKCMMKGILPDHIIHRQKMGFPTPLKIMFQKDLADYAKQILTDPSCKLHRYFQKKYIARLLNEHISKKRDHHRVIWQLIVLEIWMQTWLKN